jgi:hypothetical protein
MGTTQPDTFHRMRAIRRRAAGPVPDMRLTRAEPATFTR